MSGLAIRQKDGVPSMIRRHTVRLSIAASCLFFTGLGLAADDRDWVAESNGHAALVLEGTGRLMPEMASGSGLEGVDGEIMIPDEGFVDRAIELLEGQIAELQRRKTGTDDPRVLQDLDIMIVSRDRFLRVLREKDRLLLPYFNVSQIVFFGLSGLLGPQVEADRRPAALVRLRRYAGLEEGYRPMTELAREALTARLDDPELVAPYRGQVEKDLENSPRYVAGLEQMFKGSDLEGYEEDLAALREQFEDYDAWLREAVLPRARTDFRQPGPLYELALEQWGVDATPEELIRDGLSGFMEIRGEMEALAPLVAESRGWDLTDYREVIAELKKEQFYGDAIVERYRQVNGTLEEVIVREGIVSLPERPAIIRIASDAEAAAVPVPHLKTPPLANNKGELVEFLIPVPSPPDEDSPGAVTDNTFEAMAWTLAAHELRPGHELQFSTMLDNGVSMARALYAFNSTNVEGWALYAEAEIKPYIPLDGQLIGLQARLHRAARSFLDPMLNTGRITPDEARRILIEDVMLLPETAEQEVNRYTFTAPGQATAYYYGYRRLQEIRAKAEIALGDRFDRRSYHDFVLNQGLLPPDLLERAVMEEYVPSRSAAVGGQGAL